MTYASPDWMENLTEILVQRPFQIDTKEIDTKDTNNRDFYF